MARRRKAKLEVSLFPFLSVLVCIIGTLSLIIISASLGSSVEDEDADAPPVISPPQVELAEKEAERDIAKAQCDVNKALLDRLLAELRRITTLQADIRIASNKANDLKLRKDKLEAGLPEILERVLAAARKLRDLRAETTRLRRKIFVPAAVRGKTRQNPIFVDCRKEGILILPNGKRVPTKDIEDSAVVSRLLSKIKTSGTWCLFMLVRRDGIKAFDELYYEVRKAGIPYGFHPVCSDDDFDVSDWKRPDWLR